MIIRTFVAPDLDKARWLLNEELGQDAVVLKTRFNNSKRKSAKPLTFVEITAALDSSLLNKRDNEHSQRIQSDIPNSTLLTISNEAQSISDICEKAELVEVIGW